MEDLRVMNVKYVDIKELIAEAKMEMLYNGQLYFKVKLNHMHVSDNVKFRTFDIEKFEGRKYKVVSNYSYEKEEPSLLNLNINKKGFSFIVHFNLHALRHEDIFISENYRYSEEYAMRFFRLYNEVTLYPVLNYDTFKGNRYQVAVLNYDIKEINKYIWEKYKKEIEEM